MIIQGSNNPITIKFDASVATMTALVVSMWNAKTKLPESPIKVWTLDDMTVSGDTVVCPITEAETCQLPDGQVTIAAKGLNGDGDTVFWDECEINIRERRDKLIQLTQTEG